MKFLLFFVLSNKILLYFLNFNRTPISIASEKGNIKIVKLLESKGAELDKPDKIHFILFSLFCSNDFDLIFLTRSSILFLYFHISFLTPLYYACCNGKSCIVKYLIEKGCDINTTDINKNTLLHSACVTGNLYLAKYLVEKGLNINSENNISITPLIFACYGSENRIIKYLIDKGADVKKKYNGEFTFVIFFISKLFYRELFAIILQK